MTAPILDWNGPIPAREFPDRQLVVCRSGSESFDQVGLVVDFDDVEGYHVLIAGRVYRLDPWEVRRFEVGSCTHPGECPNGGGQFCVVASTAEAVLHCTTREGWTDLALDALRLALEGEVWRA